MSCRAGSPVVWGSCPWSPPRAAGGRGGGGAWAEAGEPGRGGGCSCWEAGISPPRRRGVPSSHRPSQGQDLPQRSPAGALPALQVVGTAWGTHSQLSVTPDPCHQLLLKFAFRAMSQFPQPVCIRDGRTSGQRVVLHTLESPWPNGCADGSRQPCAAWEDPGTPPALPARPAEAQSLSRPLGGPECESH